LLFNQTNVPDFTYANSKNLLDQMAFTHIGKIIVVIILMKKIMLKEKTR